MYKILRKQFWRINRLNFQKNFKKSLSMNVQETFDRKMKMEQRNILSKNPDLINYLYLHKEVIFYK